jgi:tetratricopeptide (TPR) repeat protein
VTLGGTATITILCADARAGDSDVVTGHGGTDVRVDGDQLTAAFTSCSEAAACAVELARPGARRVGIAVGEAMRDHAGAWTGAPVATATALRDRATSGQILASELVRLLAGTTASLDFEPVDPDVVELRWHRDEPEAPLPAALAGDTNAFVGRDDERRRLGELWRGAASGRHGVVLIGGEPGVGKTRLAAELAQEAIEAGGTVLYGRCDEEPSIPYQPFTEALRQLVGRLPDDALDRPHARDLVRLVPELRHRVAGLPEPVAVDPETERYRLFESVVGLLRDASSRAPIVFVLDDLHWAAAPTLLLLRHVIRSPDPLPLLVVGTYRDTELDRTHPLAGALADLRRDETVERVALHGLREPDVLDLVYGVSEGVGHDVRSFAATLHRETDGNPFFVGEVLRHLVETGALAERGGRWTLTTDLDDVGLPEGIREVIGRRLDRLSPAANRALRVAAVIGPEFDLGLLESVPDAIGDADDLLDPLDEAVRARLIREVPGAPGRYAFAHALVRHTLESELTATRTVRLHAAIGAAIERRFGNHLDDHLSALAGHFSEAAATGADAAGKAAHYALRAARRATAQLAPEEALAAVERGLQALEGLDRADDRLEAELRVTGAEVQGAHYDYRNLRPTVIAAADAARRADDARLLARAVIVGGYWAAAGAEDAELHALVDEALARLPDDEPALRAQLLVARVVNRGLAGGDVVGVMDTAEEALELARHSDDVRAFATAANAVQWLLIASPDLHRPVALTEEVLGRTGAAGPGPWSLLAQWPLVRVAMASGDRARAELLVEQISRQAAAVRARAINFNAGGWRACLAMSAGRFDEAEPLMELALSGDPADPNIQSAYAAQLLWLRHEQGRLGELAPMFTSAADHLRSFPAFGAFLALVALRTGDEATARRELDRLADDGFSALANHLGAAPSLASASEVAAALAATEHASRLHELLLPFSGQLLVTVWGIAVHGAADRFLALLAELSGADEEADRRFAAAAALEEAFASPPLAARTRYWWGRSLRRRGDDARADELLRDAAGVAESLGMAELAAAVTAAKLD